MKKLSIYLALIAGSLLFQGCKKDKDDPTPMSAEDQIENSGDPVKFLAGEYFTHESNNFITGNWETSDDPEGYGQVKVIKSRYFLTLVAKGSDSLTVSIRGDGGFGPLTGNLGTFGATATNAAKNEYVLRNKFAGVTITRIAQAGNTLYSTSRLNLVNDKNENRGYLAFNRVSKGIVKK